MHFARTAIEGVVIVDIERHEDQRGSFARTWCANEFGDEGIDTAIAQCNMSENAKAGTLRGLHVQIPPHGETKLVRCVRGALYDVAVDIRPRSATFGAWVGVELSAANGRALSIPQGCLHGFVTLMDATDVYYQMSAFYAPGFQKSVRWNDPLFGINWPIEPRLLSEHDRAIPDAQESDVRTWFADPDGIAR